MAHRSQGNPSKQPAGVGCLAEGESRESYGRKRWRRQRNASLPGLFRNKTGVPFQIVPYRGGPPMMQDLIATQVAFSCPEASQNLAQYRSGRIKVFAVMSRQRWQGA